MKRYFDRRSKRHLYLVNEGRCNKCGGILGKIWDAHHKRRYADGGITELTNGEALCERCHIRVHRKKIGMIEPRGWQERALDKFIEDRGKFFLINATPGAGKTILDAFIFQHLLENDIADFAVIVVPTTPLKGDADAGFLGDWNKVGIDLTTVLKDGKGRPSEFRGAVITYQQLPNLITTFETWSRNGTRIALFPDEMHHASEDNSWGNAIERVGDISVKIIGSTGTPFRGDKLRISFVSYDNDGKAVADVNYDYRKAVKERVCRAVQIILDDGIAEFIRRQDEEKESVRISEADTDDKARGTANTIYRADSNWLRKVIERADANLDEYRAVDPNAGGLIVCRPGTGDNDERHLRQVAKLVRELTGEEPEVISHDEIDANAKIERFRKGSGRWICAVRKISEGVDIKRLRVLVMATRPTTELLFRQLVGRVVRVINPKREEHATVFVAKFPQLRDWAAAISDEAQGGLKDRADSDDNKDSDSSERKESSFVALGSVHEGGGAVSVYGDEYTEAEINAAEMFKANDHQMFDWPITKIAYFLRKAGIAPDPAQPAKKPLHVEKKEIRSELHRAVQRLAIRRNPDEPDYKRVWLDIRNKTGARNIDDLFDNHGIEVMRQALQLVHAWLGGRDAN